jgi:non-homologous end joining protein Ku
MVDLAAHILASKETRFDPRKFKDDYEAALKKLVAQGQRPYHRGARAEEPAGNVVSLMDALKQSLGKRRRSNQRAAQAQGPQSRPRPQSRVTTAPPPRLDGTLVRSHFARP